MARKERLTVFLTSDIIEAIRICAIKKRKRTSDMVAVALREFLAKNNCQESETSDILNSSDGGKEYVDGK